MMRRRQTVRFPLLRIQPGCRRQKRPQPLMRRKSLCRLRKCRKVRLTARPMFCRMKLPKMRPMGHRMRRERRLSRLPLRRPGRRC